MLVTATANRNMEFCAGFLLGILKVLNLTEADLELYREMERKVYPVNVHYRGKSITVQLRQEFSLMALYAFGREWDYFTRKMAPATGGSGELKPVKSNLQPFMVPGLTNEAKEFFFPSEGELAAKFELKRQRRKRLHPAQAEHPRALHDFREGGIVIYEKDGHGLVSTVCDIGEYYWDHAVSICDELYLNGYSDWHLPDRKELKLLQNEWNAYKLGGFYDNFYWSSETGQSRLAWQLYFSINGTGSWRRMFHHTGGYVRAVRRF